MVRQPLALNFLKYNVRLFGVTVKVRGRPTAVYCDDHQRASLFEDRFRALVRTGASPDFVGMTEFWDESLVSIIKKRGFWDKFNYCHGPFGRGFPEIFEVMREKSAPLYYLISLYPDVVVKYFARTQLLDGVREVNEPLAGTLKAVDEMLLRPAKERLVEMMQDRTFLGSGLFLLSRHPIVSSRFVPFTSRKYGLDRYAQKGVLHASVALPAGWNVSIFLSHLHVGKGKEDQAARREQIIQLKRMIDESPDPSVVEVDMNIVAEKVDPRTGRLVPSDEYLWAVKTLGLVDTFREFHPDPNAGPESWGYTYDDTTHFSEVLGIDGPPELGRHLQRIDYIFRDRHFRALSAQVSRNRMRHPRYGGRDLSDHFPLCAELALEGD